MNKIPPKTLLLLKNRALGDSVMGLSTLQYLREILHKETKIIYAVPAWIFPLYKNVQTSAHKIIPLKFKTIGDWWQSYKILKSLEIDMVLELFQSGRTKHFFKLFSPLLHVKYYFHNHHDKTGPVRDQGIIKSNIQRDLDAAWTFFAPQRSPPHFLNYPPLMEKSVKKKHQITFGVVATRETKMWPLTHYKELSLLIQEYDPTLKIIIPLGPNDNDSETQIQKLNFPQNSMIVKKNLEELPLILAESQLYIGNDTGQKHISIAMKIPTLTFFGPEPPREWHPYDPREHPYFYKENLECRTRNAHYCGLSTCDSMICLNQFSPKDVFKKLCPFLPQRENSK